MSLTSRLTPMRGIAALLMFAVAPSVASGQVVYSVCQLLKDPAEHSGETVRIRGVLLQLPVATVVADPECREMPTFHSQSWEPEVWIDWMASAKSAVPQVGGLEALAKQAAAEGKLVSATFEGVLKDCLVQNGLVGSHELWSGCGSDYYYLLRLELTGVSDMIAVPDPFRGKERVLPPKEPAVDLWRVIRERLTGPEGTKYFVAYCMGFRFPYLTGKLISVASDSERTRLVLAMDDGAPPDVAIELKGLLAFPVEPGSVITFGGVGKSYTPTPSLVTFSIDDNWYMRSSAGR